MDKIRPVERLERKQKNKLLNWCMNKFEGEPYAL